MRLTHLELEEFRAYRRVSLPISPAGLRIHGQNASGKSSLLEAIYLLATMRSPRTSQEREAINWSSGEEYAVAPYTRVRGAVEHDHHESEIEVVIAVDPERGVARRRVKLDGRGRRAIDVVGTLKVVLFAPEDLNLVLGSPSGRRRYLDISISQIDATYLKTLSRYSRILEQRNSLLKDLGSRRGAPSSADEELSYWDGELLTQSAYLIATRVRYLAQLGVAASREFQTLARTDASLRLSYVGTIPLPDAQLARIAEAPAGDAQAYVARSFEAELRRRRDDELRRGMTLIGPHRDDIRFLLGERDLAAYGSRGQQRLAVVATKLAELQEVLALAHERPVLLLDDVLSELDPEHQERLLDAVAEAGCQLFITAIDRALIERPSLATLPFVETGAGDLNVDLDPDAPSIDPERERAGPDLAPPDD